MDVGRGEVACLKALHAKSEGRPDVLLLCQRVKHQTKLVCLIRELVRLQPCVKTKSSQSVLR